MPHRIRDRKSYRYVGVVRVDGSGDCAGNGYVSHRESASCGMLRQGRGPGGYDLSQLVQPSSNPLRIPFDGVRGYPYGRKMDDLRFPGPPSPPHTESHLVSTPR